jgi:alpha-1,2-mannosyltransferase
VHSGSTTLGLTCACGGLSVLVQAAHNNDAAIASSPLRSSLKLGYYKLFAACYAMVGRRASVIMANSSWTAGHLRAIWGERGIAKVFPPCNTTDFQKIPLDLARRHASAHVVSIAQFRPEKAHRLQLEAFALLLEQ